MVQDIIDAISHQEMKLHDMDDSAESYDPSGGSEILERCDDCYKIRSVFIHFYWPIRASLENHQPICSRASILS